MLCDCHLALSCRPDNAFEISIDGESVRNGSLLEDFSPSVNPPEEIGESFWAHSCVVLYMIRVR